MIGIVVVSHSQALGNAAVALAKEMVSEENCPKIAVAAGLDEETFGTDAMAIMEAIEQVDSPDGVLVMVDLGSAVLSSETALEFLDDEVCARVCISPAPLVEGLVAAIVTASTGGTLQDCAREAEDGLNPKQEHLASSPSLAEPSDQLDEVDFCVDSPEIFTTIIANPHGLHARPAANFVGGLRGFESKIEVFNETTGKGPAPANSLNKVAALGLRKSDTMRVVVLGPDQEQVVAKLAELAGDNFGEDLTEAEPVIESATPVANSGDDIVFGEVFVSKTSIDVSNYQAGTPEEEAERIDRVFTTVMNQLSSLSTAHQDQMGIFMAQQALLEDPEMVEKLHADAAGGQSAVAAVQYRFDEAAADFDSLSDPYLRERGQDVRSIQRFLLAGLTGQPAPKLLPEKPCVLVVDELDAAGAAGLDPAVCLGVIILSGGLTGHGAIVAASRGIPVLAGTKECHELNTGDQIAFDPRSQKVWVNPTAQDLAELNDLANARQSEAAQAKLYAKQPAVTSFGKTIKVETNVGCESDAVTGFANGAEGSGLVRTEILFPGPLAPDAKTQAEVFTKISELLAGETITIRTWDVGGDKPLPYLPQQQELNPFLGERGLRTMRRVPEFFREQLKGILLASRKVGIRVMFPMVTEPEEIVWAKRQLALAGEEVKVEPEIEVGMMVEVPSAALRVHEFAPLIDFVSIGTNDLTQYTTATDRGNQVVAHLAKGDSPAVLGLIGATCAGMEGKPVAVCGDLASDISMVETLVDLGVTELSVRPPLVALIKQAVRKI